MRENKKVLKFRKFKIANLNRKQIIGGTEDPANDTTTGTHVNETEHPTCQTKANGMCTEGATVTELKNGCTEGDGNQGLNSGPNCP
ncbi:hypothetical protein IMCC3317_32540 [Kordia antarctica]|uniref:Uncharacterized protein n=1 Tax=Kordia antarctica TaxID=1218801 RepID=A0A7L4ZMZ1_9FLAO|nr:hypothetical protein [Kordia antarctica]QHI37871.1 hypothetical protein IMCC3317_32540 [Kordia antarctica]